MSRVCSLCSHHERAEIDRSIISGQPYRDIAGQFAVSKSAVERHASSHLAEAIARHSELEGKITADRLIAELRTVREVTLGVLEEARQGRDAGMALKAIARLEKQSELVGKLAGELIERQRIDQTSIVFNDQWLRLRAVIMRAVEGHPEVRTLLLHELAKLEPLQ